MGVMLLCSGQGTQHPAMFARLAEEPAAQPVLDAASHHMGFDLRKLEAKADEVDFADNRIAQLLVTTHCLAVHAALEDDPVDLCVGYSVGEIAAVACAGGFGPEEAFAFIEERARCMNAARDASGFTQGMLAAIGVPRGLAEAIATKVGAEIAIVNGSDHVVLGGPDLSLDAIEPELLACGARNIRRLPVRVASHTRFIAQAGPPFAQVIGACHWTPPRIPVLSGIDGRPIRTHADASRALSEQLWRPLDFHRCLESAMELGATCAIEIGPGRTLTRLMNELFPEVPIRAFEDFRTVSGVRKWLKAHSSL